MVTTTPHITTITQEALRRDVLPAFVSRIHPSTPVPAIWGSSIYCDRDGNRVRCMLEVRFTSGKCVLTLRMGLHQGRIPHSTIRSDYTGKLRVGNRHYTTVRPTGIGCIA